MPKFRRDELEITEHESECCEKANLGRVKALGANVRSTPISGGNLAILVCEECGSKYFEIDGEVFRMP